MERKEEIFSAAVSFANAVSGGTQDSYFDIALKTYQEGAKWADEHPRKGLWDSKKVIEFLKDRIAHNSIAYLMTTKYLIDDLKKTMEEK